MPRHINDHIPTGATVAISHGYLMAIEDLVKAEFAKLTEALAGHGEGNHGVGAVLSDEQFARIEELLKPGHELSTMMLADYKAQRAAAKEPRSPAKTAVPKNELDAGASSES